ncbi:HNH endonuclease family protein, partial [Kitasatospora sp. NPDC047058]|uniref:HNH endonuclease family protein n=1 Tax=Kitasatospora sp. NPDC047058 TaxID=3155620 RepID=UPI0033DD8F67
MDVDPLAEAWDSGAFAWSSKEREAYANDLGDPRSLIAVSAKSNRSKADKDVAEWMPQAAHYACTYLTDWTTVKTRWSSPPTRARRPPSPAWPPPAPTSPSPSNSPADHPFPGPVARTYPPVPGPPGAGLRGRPAAR